MTALVTYQDQVAFARRHIKSENITCCGCWREGMAWGVIWSGVVTGFHVRLETIGSGPLMRAGSFRVHAIGDAK